MNILMFAHGGSLNRGCEAIVRSSVAMIKSRMSESRIYLASSMPESDRSIAMLDGIYDGRDRLLKPYSYAWWMASLQYKLFKKDSYVYRSLMRNVIKRIKDADLCLSIGGDNYCYGEQPGLYEVNKSVKSQGKKLVLWGCSIGEEDMSQRKLDDLKRFDLILARESLTYELLSSLGIDRVKHCADPAFTMDVEELPLPDGWQEGNTIGINFSPLVMNLSPSSQAAVHALIGHILTTTDMTIALTPHVTQLGNNDAEVLKMYYEQFKDTNRVLLLPTDLNAMQYKGYISKMRFFIGARTHATIAAYSTCVPTMVLGYSIKSKGIAKDLFNEEKLVLDLKELSDSKQIISMFNELLEDEHQLLQQLHQSVPRIKEMSYKAADDLQELAM